MVSLKGTVDEEAKSDFIPQSLTVSPTPSTLKGKTIQLNLASLIHRLYLDYLLCGAMRQQVKTEGRRKKISNWYHLPLKLLDVLFV